MDEGDHNEDKHKGSYKITVAVDNDDLVTGIHNKFLKTEKDQEDLIIREEAEVALKTFRVDHNENLNIRSYTEGL